MKAGILWVRDLPSLHFWGVFEQLFSRLKFCKSLPSVYAVLDHRDRSLLDALDGAVCSRMKAEQNRHVRMTLQGAIPKLNFDNGNVSFFSFPFSS